VVEDTIGEDASVVIDTPDGLIVISGCGHAGIINILEQARRVVREATVVAAVGGFHLFPADDKVLTWTGTKLKEFGVRYLLGAHCTGVETVFQLRSIVGLTRADAVVGAVGSTFILGRGIDALALAR
jgi:7,8-dihydropterin-6-yl-methyl-4-(beta-D-ribofuranosyl)aminobenzene 5'-phosphate synthase